MLPRLRIQLVIASVASSTREVHVQFELKGIDRQSVLIGAQCEGGAGRAGLGYAEASIAREAVSRQRVAVAAAAVLAADQHADDGEQQRCPARPDRRISLPLQVTVISIAQSRQLRALWVDGGRQTS